MLTELDSKTAIIDGDLNLSTWKGILHGSVERLHIADFKNGLPSCGEIAPIMTEYRCARAKLCPTRWRIRIRTEMIVEAPAAHQLSQLHYLCGALWIG